MKPTPYPHVNLLLDNLLTRMQTILGTKLVSLYLYGSLVAGDYDETVSDVDLLAALASDLNEAEFDGLKRMHAAIVAQDNRWDNHVEVAYLSLEGLKTFRTKTSKLGIISPGEPFHIVDAGKDWLINWYVVQQIGVTLYGRLPQETIDSIAKDEFIQIVKEHVARWREWLKISVDTRGSQAYVILTLCRALYTLTHGEQVSKLKAASWAETELPAYAATIRNAVIWRKAQDDDTVDHAATLPETKQFVNFVINRILD
jgi:hypothetical protein